MPFIWAHNPYASAMHDGSISREVNVKFTNGSKEISIVLDNSCGALGQLSRGELRCYQGNTDRTEAVLGYERSFQPTMDTLLTALAWLEG